MVCMGLAPERTEIGLQSDPRKLRIRDRHPIVTEHHANERDKGGKASI